MKKPYITAEELEARALEGVPRDMMNGAQFRATEHSVAVAYRNETVDEAIARRMRCDCPCCMSRRQ